MLRKRCTAHSRQTRQTFDGVGCCGVFNHGQHGTPKAGLPQRRGVRRRPPGIFPHAVAQQREQALLHQKLRHCLRADARLIDLRQHEVERLVEHAARRRLCRHCSRKAAWRYVDFFTANIRNPNTRRAYARACRRFFAWCDDHGLALAAIRPFDVSAYIEELQQTHGAPGVKQQLAAIRMLFDWLIIGQIVPFNPASAVRGPKHVVKVGKTPVLEAAEWRQLLDFIPTETVRDLRDRALIATLTYPYARIGAR